MRRSVRALLTLALWLSVSISPVPPVSSWIVQASPASPAPLVGNQRPSQSVAAFSLDGVGLTMGTAFFRHLEFATPEPSSSIQVATAIERDPLYKELSVIAVPFGTEPPTESLPTAAWDSEEMYRAALREYREAQGGNPQSGGVIRLFDRDVVGLTSQVDLPLGRSGLTRVLIAEWVVQAGPRVWIVRASQELTSDAPPEPQAMDSLVGTTLISDDLEQPSTSLAVVEQRPSPTDADLELMIEASSVDSELPFPSWWRGDCDIDFFRQQTGVDSYPLGAEYRGLKACGPRPWADGGPQTYVDFGAGPRQIEWQCPELTKRFLYLAYGIPPYLAHGSQVVWNYSGDLLEKVPNCAAGRAPQPNDVLSYGSTSTYGHTSVVIVSDVDSGGNGRIWVIEQNNSPTGLNSLAVNNWCVEPTNTEVSGWLHNPLEHGWGVAYYSDEAFTLRCRTSYQDGLYLFGDWRGETPGGGCPVDRLTARFSRQVAFDGGDYTFALGYAGRARLMVDGETVIDGWEKVDQRHETIYHLERGDYELTVEYHHEGGDAYLAAFWWGPGFELTREERDSSRWYAQYWPNRTLGGVPVVMLNHGTGFLDQNWGLGGPAANLPVDRFSSRFERTVTLDEGRWRFVVSTDDGVRFWIGDVLILDEWRDQVATFRPVFDLEQGDHELRLEHYENRGAAHLRVSWERVDTATSLTGQITSPMYAAVVDSCPLVIKAEIDNQAEPEERTIRSVELHAAYDDEWHHLGAAETPPYEWHWDCSSVNNQGIWLALHVVDNTGHRVIDLGGHVYITLELSNYVHLPLVVRGAADGTQPTTGPFGGESLLDLLQHIWSGARAHLVLAIRSLLAIIRARWGT